MYDNPNLRTRDKGESLVKRNTLDPSLVDIFCGNNIPQALLGEYSLIEIPSHLPYSYFHEVSILLVGVLECSKVSYQAQPQPGGV